MRSYLDHALAAIGAKDTELARYTPAIVAFFYVRVMTQNAAMGALPVLRAASDPGVLGGQYYGPGGFFGARATRNWPSPAGNPTTRPCSAACGQSRKS